MEPFANLTPMARRNVLAVIMLVILLALTAAAWVVSRSISPLRQGETWYLARAGERLIGWQVVQREEVPGEGGWGYSVELLERGPDARVTWSRWTLQSDRREGDYRSQVGVLRRGRPLADRVVEIEYDAPRVVIRNTGLGLRATAEVGADYIPEGRLEPLIADVARTGEAVQGTLAADAQRAVVPVVIEPEGRVSYRLNGRPVELTAVRLTWPSADAGAAAGRFLVDDGGSIAVQQLLDPQGHVVQTFERASLKQVRLHYPRAHVLRNQVLEATEEE